MSWGLFVGAKAARAAIRESEDRPRRDGGTPGAPTSPRPVSFVIPVSFGIAAGCLLASAGLVVVAYFLRFLSGRSTPGEALGAALVGALLCGLPGVALAVLGAAGHRQRQRYQRVQTLVGATGSVAVAEIARDLGVEPKRARQIALEVLREDHVIGRLDEASGRLVAAPP